MIRILTLMLSIMTKIVKINLTIMWKYQNAKDYNPNWSVITDLNSDKIVKILYEKELQQMSQT